PFDFSLTPRQIQEAFRILGHTTSVSERKGDYLYYHIANGVIFLTFLNVWKPELFHEFQSGNISMDRLLEMISKLPISKNRDWWATVLIMSLDQKNEERNIEQILAAFVKHGFIEKETTVEQFQQY